MPQIEHPCKLCGKPAIARWENDADQEAVDRFIPLLAHNHCADLLRKRNDSEDRILALCFTYSRAGSNERGKIIEPTRRLLMENTRRYAEAIAEIRHLPTVMWTEDFVDLLLDHPGDTWKILKQYRDKLPGGEHLNSPR